MRRNDGVINFVIDIGAFLADAAPMIQGVIRASRQAKKILTTLISGDGAKDIEQEALGLWLVVDLRVPCVNAVPRKSCTEET